MTTADVYASETRANLSKEEREKLILDNLPLVHWIASRLHENLPKSISVEDLVSTGIVGLIAAIDNFDPRYNVKLSSYAHHRIRGAMLDSIRGMDGIAEGNRPKVKKVEAAISGLEQRLHRTPTEEEIAAELSIPLAEYQEWLVQLQGVKIDTIEGNGESVAGGLLNLLAATQDNEPAYQLEQAELEKVLADGISKLPKKESMVLSLYFKDGLTLKEIAEVLGYHLTRIGQLKAQGILRLRAYLERYWPMKAGVDR